MLQKLPGTLRDSKIDISHDSAKQVYPGTGTISNTIVTQKSVSDCPNLLNFNGLGAINRDHVWGYKIQNTKNLSKTCEDKVQKNEVSEKDSTLLGVNYQTHTTVFQVCREVLQIGT